MANSNLIFSISAKDEASGTFRKIKVSLGELQQASGGAGEAAGDLGSIFSSQLGKLAGGVAGFFAVGQITQTALELGKLGATAERTRGSYENLAAGAGVSGQAMLDAMRQATAGTVADSELMLSANRAMMLGVADNAQEMSQLMAAAIERGRSLGVSSSQAVSDIITGIGRMSPMILDNLGITGAAQAFDEYAKSLGKTAEQLTDVEKKQALVNAVLAQSSGAAVANDAAAAFERMDASLQNAKEALGVLFSPAIAAIAEQIAAAATTAADAATEQASASARTLALRQQLAGTRGYSALAGIDDPDQQQRILEQVLAQTQQAQQQAAQEAVRLAQNAQAEIAAIYASTPGVSQADAGRMYQEQLAAAQAATVELQAQQQQIVAVMGGWIGAKDAQVEYNRSLWEGVGAWTAFQTEAQLTEQAVLGAMDQIVSGAQGRLAGIAQQLEAAQGGGAGVGWLENANKQLERQIQLWADAGYSIQDITNVLLPVYLTNLGQIVDRSVDAYTATAGIGKGAKQAASDAQQSFRRIVAGLDVVSRRARMAAGEIGRMGAMASAVEVGQMGKSKLGFGFKPIDYVPIEKSADAVNTLDGAFSDLFDTTLGGGGLGDVNDELSDLKSKVQGVIDSATVNDFGVNPEDFLPREDAINENARRLGAIVRDGIGNQEWLEEFKQEVPGVFEEIANSANPQQAAARILQEFQNGMRPELLDREMIKDRVRQMLLGDQGSAQLAQEIAQELSNELGVSLAEAQQAAGAALGTGGAMLPGSGQAGPDGTVQGGTFVSAWVKQVTSMVTDFESSGITAGNAFGTGFMSVQSTYISQWAAALISIVTAGVIANMAQQGSRTGAK